MDIPAIVRRQRTFFRTGSTRFVEFRCAQLNGLAAALERHEPALLSALESDLRKSPLQAYTTELGPVQTEIRHAQRHLHRWTAPQRRRTPWFVAPARGWVQPEPFGVALVLGPWNYPVQLLLTPLVSALAAGNCVILKPSELAPRTAKAVTEMLQDCFTEDYVAVLNGDAAMAEELLSERFNKIFFTGSARIGRIVMAAAARHLTPVTLELGGKCPAIVCSDSSIELAARRLVWGKFLNAGQTCVAPDFVLVDRRVGKTFLDSLRSSLQKCYGEDPRLSPDYGRIVNRGHFERLLRYLNDGELRHGGSHDVTDLFLAPTVLGRVKPNAPVMQEEIFGPILPVLEYDRLEEALALLREQPTPLALYLFTSNRETERQVLAQVQSGGACVNDVVSHMLGTRLPFGGLAESGMGAYHGKAGFDAFSHSRAVLRRATWLDLPFRYPPQNLSLTGIKRAFRFLMND